MRGHNATHEERTSVGQSRYLFSSYTFKAARLNKYPIYWAFTEENNKNLFRSGFHRTQVSCLPADVKKNVHSYTDWQTPWDHRCLIAYHFEVKVLLQFTQHKWFPCFTLMLGGNWALLRYQYFSNETLDRLIPCYSAMASFNDGRICIVSISHQLFSLDLERCVPRASPGTETGERRRALPVGPRPPRWCQLYCLGETGQGRQRDVN